MFNTDLTLVKCGEALVSVRHLLLHSAPLIRIRNRYSSANLPHLDDIDFLLLRYDFQLEGLVLVHIRL